MATLKINELSVGDWVQYRGIICPICSIYKEVNATPDEVALGSKDIFLGVVPVSKLRPIPITAEILEANGFAPDEYSNKIWSFIAERELIQYFFVNHKLCIRNHRNAVDVDVLHIHQLQHALRLAGLDKEINLS